MARSRVGKYGVLNVVSQPHPAGAYKQLFNDAAEKSIVVSVRSDRFARLGSVTQSRNYVFSGVIAFWTEVDPNGKAIRKSDLQQSALADLGVSLPEGIGFNSRIFAYSFNEKTHKLFVQTKNDYGDVVSIHSLRVAFEALLREALPREWDSVNVHLETASDALERVISLPVITKIRVVVYRPNPDNIDELVERKVRELEQGNISRLKTIANKAKGASTLKLVGDLRAAAELARDNGIVEVSGKEDGRRVTRSTDEYPLEISEKLEADQTSAVVTRRLAEG